MSRPVLAVRATAAHSPRGGTPSSTPPASVSGEGTPQDEQSSPSLAEGAPRVLDEGTPQSEQSSSSSAEVLQSTDAPESTDALESTDAPKSVETLQSSIEDSSNSGNPVLESIQINDTQTMVLNCSLTGRLPAAHECVQMPAGRTLCWICMRRVLSATVDGGRKIQLHGASDDRRLLALLLPHVLRALVGRRN